jgi:putative tryptophan/tyrosine transport system substrate-binding protein
VNRARRRIAVALGALAIGGPWRLEAQSLRRVALLTWRGSMMDRDMGGGRDFHAAMARMGYAEGRSVVYDERYWKASDVAVLARELVALDPDVIVAAGPPSILAAKAATDRVPIVMMYSAEPVETGIVRSLNRPGGNITGLTWDHGFETVLKEVELLKEVLPALQRLAVLWDATDSVHPIYWRHCQKAAPQAGLQLISTPVRQFDDVSRAVAEMKKQRAGALLLLPSGQLTVPRRIDILEQAMKARIPALFAYVGRDAPNALLQHGPNLSAMPRRAAAYVDRILRGAKPGEIPIEQPDKYDLVVDLSAARKLGIKLPQSVLARADRVIQ